MLFAAPQLDQVEFFWEECLWATDALIQGDLVDKNLTKHLLDFWHTGRIRAKTAHDADSLRGDYADLLLLEEYAWMDPSAWSAVGAPMMLDTDGETWFMSSPNRKNHFHKMYLRAKADGTGRWMTTHVTSHENPHLSEEALAEIVEDMTEDDYKQEILAEFLAFEGQVFKNIEINLWSPEQEDIRKHKNHRIVAGIDWMVDDAYSAISIGCADCKKELVLDRFRKIRYPEAQRIVKAHRDRWDFELLAEANSVGQPVIDQLQEDGVSTIGFTMTNDSKALLVKSMQLALERETWKWLDNDIATAELEAFEQKVTLAGNLRYHAPSGVYDDTIVARMLMLRQALMGYGTLI